MNEQKTIKVSAEDYKFLILRRRGMKQEKTMRFCGELEIGHKYKGGNKRGCKYIDVVERDGVIYKCRHAHRCTHHTLQRFNHYWRRMNYRKIDLYGRVVLWPEPAKIAENGYNVKGEYVPQLFWKPYISPSRRNLRFVAYGRPDYALPSPCGLLPGDLLAMSRHGDLSPQAKLIE